MTTTPAAPHMSVGDMPEGVTLPLPQQNLSTEEERQVRKQELAAAFRLFARFGFSEGVAGHITARDPENPSVFWVNPFGMSFSQIRVSDLILVDHDGKLLEGKRPVNNAAFCIHSEVHRARPDAVAAAHTHSLHGKAFSSLGVPLEPITQDACAFFEDHGIYSDYRGVVNDTEEGRRIGVALGKERPSFCRTTGCSRSGPPSPRRPGTSSPWNAPARRSCWPWPRVNRSSSMRKRRGW